MTVALGLVCSDGVLVASDSMASAGQVAAPVRKVYALPSLPIIWTASGSQFVIEEVAAALIGLDETAQREQTVRDRYLGPDLAGIRQNLRTFVHDALKKSYESALPSGLQQGGPDGRHKFVTDVLILGWAKHSPYFLEFAGDGQINWHTDEGFYAVGSGGPFAFVAHGLMKHYLAEGPVSLQDGQQLAYRAIETTCDVSSAYVAEPVQLAVVDDNGARVVTDVEPLKETVAGWRTLERETLRRRADKAEEGKPEDLPELDAPS